MKRHGISDRAIRLATTVTLVLFLAVETWQCHKQRERAVMWRDRCAVTLDRAVYWNCMATGESYDPNWLRYWGLDLQGGKVTVYQEKPAGRARTGKDE